MKKYFGKHVKRATVLITGFAILVIVTATKESSPAYEDVISDFETKFQSQTEILHQTALQFSKGSIEADSMRVVLQETRLAYKKIEFKTVHYFPEYTKSHLNGAPLWHLERTGTQSVVLPPEGLQFLDEAFWANHPGEEAHELAQVSLKLQNTVSTLMPELRRKKMNDADLFKAFRKQLIAIATLGITGFDTPGSANGIQESKASLNAMHEILKTIDGSSEQINKALPAIENALTYLELNTDFDTFDRAYFIRNSLNPLYAALLIPQSKDFTKEENTAWNDQSTNLFDPNFLDPYYYTELEAEDDSPALRSLGEKLFYDSELSFNGELSCNSCHRPEKAFTDGRSRSTSNVKGKTVERNAPTLLNAVYADRYFYDLRAFTLEQQAEHVIFNPLEFNSAYDDIALRMKKDSEYARLISQALGDKSSNRDIIAKALSSYVLSLQSFNSPFDQYMRKEKQEIPDEVKRGFNLFMGKAACGTCHFAPTFSGLVPPYYQESESEILGVFKSPEEIVLDGDPGRIANGITNEEEWIYERSFKTSTVRNIALTAPYFHNGSYGSLEKVMEFYNNGGGEGHGLRVSNQTLGPDSLKLNNEEISDIITFMNSLTDNPHTSSHQKSIN